MKGLFRILMVLAIATVPLLGFAEETETEEPEDPPVEELKSGSLEFPLIFQSVDDGETSSEDEDTTTDQ